MDLEIFQKLPDSNSKRIFLNGLDKDLFQSPKETGKPRKWQCPGCVYHARSKQHLFNHICRPCPELQNKELPFYNWNDYYWPENLGFEYPNLVPESLFQKMLRKQTSDLKTEEQRINYWKSFVGQIVRLVETRGYMQSSFKIIDEKWHIRFEGNWLKISEEGRDQYEDWKREIILPFIRNNLDNWFQWHIQNNETSSDWNEWSIGVFGKVVRPHIPDEFY